MNNYFIYRHRDINGKVFYIGCTKDRKRSIAKYSVNAKKHHRSLEWLDFRGDSHPKPMLNKKRPEHSKLLSGENNTNVSILLNVETGIFYFGCNEASNSTEHLSMYNIRDAVSGKVKKNRSNFIDTGKK